MFVCVCVCPLTAATKFWVEFIFQLHTCTSQLLKLVHVCIANLQLNHIDELDLRLSSDPNTEQCLLTKCSCVKRLEV